MTVAFDWFKAFWKHQHFSYAFVIVWVIAPFLLALTGFGIIVIMSNIYYTLVG